MSRLHCLQGGRLDVIDKETIRDVRRGLLKLEHYELANLLAWLNDEHNCEPEPYRELTRV